MEIISVKIQSNGWLLNGTMSVPNASGNRERELIVEWLKTNTPEPEFTEAELLVQAKGSKRNEIRQAFTTASEAPVLVGTVSYHGGFDSAIKLDAAKRLVESAGGLEVVFYDVDNLPHILTLAEAQTVITTIGADYQTKFGIKQAKMVQVENATTILEVENVSA